MSQRSLEIVIKVVGARIEGQWKGVSKRMWIAVKDKSKKLKLQKLFFCGIGRLVVNVPPMLNKSLVELSGTRRESNFKGRLACSKVAGALARLRTHLWPSTLLLGL